MEKYYLYQSERKRIHRALHSLSLAEGTVVLDSRVPGFYKRAKELADQTWAPASEWESIKIILDDYDVFVFHQACLRPAEPLHDAAEWAREVFDPPTERDVNFYGRGWATAREEALERDGFVCKSCGCTNEEHEKEYTAGLHVHHKRPVRKFDNPRNAHELSNLKVLCIDCHQSVHSSAEVGK